MYALNMALEVLAISFPSHVNNGHCNNKICHSHGHFLLISNVALTGVMIDPQAFCSKFFRCNKVLLRWVICCLVKRHLAARLHIGRSSRSSRDWSVWIVRSVVDIDITSQRVAALNSSFFSMMLLLSQTE